MLNLHKQIECDRHNIQELIDRMPHATTKGEYRGIVAAIKVLVKEIHNQKVDIEDKLFDSPEKVKLPLFEVEPSQVSSIELYKEMDSFFGKLK